jgi:DNA polymerase III subunit gamma/tau
MSNRLDLKYRPRRFDQVLGNDIIKKLLLIRSRNHTISEQSMLFGGPKGCGKTTLARLVARALVCTALKEDGEPCGECPECISALNETNKNIEELDAASQGTVDKIRSMVKESEYEALPGSNIYIIDEAQRLSASAQDALLKNIEDRTLFVILCTTEPYKIREPIRSRVEEYSVQYPSTVDLYYRIRDICRIENIKFEEDAVYEIIKVHRGCPRSCVISVESLANLGTITHNSIRSFFGFDNYDLILQILRSIDTKPNTAFETLDKLSANETPTWIRHNIVLAISSIMRQRIKIGHSYPIEIRDDLPPDLIEMAQDLGKIDRPVISDIEAILLKRAFRQSIVSAPQFKTSEPIERRPSLGVSRVESEIVPETKLEVKLTQPDIEFVKNSKPLIKTIEFDGIKFSSDENLTSLDSKIVVDTSITKIETETDVISVKLNKDHVPLTEKQFIEKFISRVKGKNFPT